METGLDLIVRAIGERATLALVERHGGKIRRIPKRPTAEWRELLGEPAARALCQMFGDSRIQIPKAMQWRRAARDRLIIELYEAHLRGEPGGLGIHQLVERFDLVETTIHRILKRPKPDSAPWPAQLRRDTMTRDLFEDVDCLDTLAPPPPGRNAGGR